MAGEVGADRFTWVLLSDIHHGDGNRTSVEERKTVLRAILNDLQPSGTSWPKLDAITITGDLASKGGFVAGEYDEASEYLTRLKTQHPTARQFFVVPGNHDVNRSADKDTDIRRLVDSLRSGRDSLDDVLSGPEALRLMKRQESFWKFYDTHGAGESNIEFDKTGLWWTAIVARKSFSVRVVGLNSSLIAADDADQLKLRMGRKQINALTIDGESPDRQVTLLLTHHPMSWLAKDEQEFVGIVSKHCHAHLSGHIHTPVTASTRVPGQESLLTIGSGAVHEKHENGEDRRLVRFDYSICQLENTTGGLRFRRWPRTWSVGQAGFVCDSDLCERGCDYSEEFIKLRTSVGKRATASKTIESISEDSILKFGSRRTAYPTESSLLELHEDNAYLPSRFQESRTAAGKARMSAEDIATALIDGKVKNVILLGEPGAGKSFAALEIAKRLQLRGCVPIFLPLTRASEAESGEMLVERYKKLLRQHANVDRGNCRVYFFDGLDEALTTQESYNFITRVIRLAAERANVVATCRTRPIEEEWSSFVEEAGFGRIYWMAPWNVGVDLPKLLRKLVTANHISRQESANITRASNASEAVKKLMQRPLYARMLIFLLGSAATPQIQGVGDLYRAYFERLTIIAARSLKSAGCNLSDQEIGRLWQDFAADAQREDRIDQEWIKIGDWNRIDDISNRCFIRAMDHLVDNTTKTARRGYARLAHYSFFEFLVASRFARVILEATSPASERLDMGSDLSPEMRHYLVAMLRQDGNLKLPTLLETAYQQTRVDNSQTQMMIGCNLLIYLISRCCDPKVSVSILDRLCNSETDPFLLDALHWGLCHSGHPGAALRAIRRIQDKENLALYTRGYLLYYYGDLLRGAVPPFLDKADLPWPRARERILAILAREDYSTALSLERRLIDVYTFLDLAVFHQAVLTAQEIRILNYAIEGLEVTKTSRDAIHSIEKHMNQFSQVRS